MDYFMQILRYYFEPLTRFCRAVWVYQIKPTIKYLNFLRIAALVAFANGAGIPWKSVRWLCPYNSVERRAWKVKLRGGLIYSIAKNGIPQDERNRIAELDFKSEYLKKIIHYDWHCGYVRYMDCPMLSRQKNIDPDKALASMKAFREGRHEDVEEYPSVFSDYVPVHGGITYEKPDSAGYVYGFDCNHAGDADIPILQNEQWLWNEIHNMRLSIDIAVDEDFEQLYLANDTRAQRATVIDKYHERLEQEGIEFRLQENFGAMLNVLGGRL